MSVSTPFSDEQLREFAQAMVRFHDPANQQDNPYQRCAHCNYTRHPCDTYDLAAAVLRLLDRIEKSWLIERTPGPWDRPDTPGPGQPGDASEAT